MILFLIPVCLLLICPCSLISSALEFIHGAYDHPKGTDPPPGHGRIGGHYFHTWCPSGTKQTNALQCSTPDNKSKVGVN